MSEVWADGRKDTTNLQREEDIKKNLEITSGGRCDFLKNVALGRAAFSAATTLFSDVEAGEPHVAHVEMNRYYGAMASRRRSAAMGGKGEVAILNAPPGFIISAPTVSSTA
jgi:hypothetical protein